MLCCWLQQLQEFGGPEVDKPDLLKGSVGSLKGHGATTSKSGGSNNSIAARALLVDPRVRYNVSINMCVCVCVNMCVIKYLREFEYNDNK